MSGEPNAEASEHSFRCGQIEALMWVQAWINGHLRGGQPLVAAGALRWRLRRAGDSPGNLPLHPQWTVNFAATA
jgi:hypothetical protein